MKVQDHDDKRGALMLRFSPVASLFPGIQACSGSKGEFLHIDKFIEEIFIASRRLELTNMITTIITSLAIRKAQHASSDAMATGSILSSDALPKHSIHLMTASPHPLPAWSRLNNLRSIPRQLCPK